METVYQNYQLAFAADQCFLWQTLANDGKIIEAIKRVREITALGLKDSRDVVEYHRTKLMHPTSSIKSNGTVYTFIQNANGTITIEEHTVKRHQVKTIADVVRFMHDIHAL